MSRPDTIIREVKTAFFYWDARPQRTTSTFTTLSFCICFSATGQRNVQLDSDRQAGIWVVEGIALYFESLSLLSNGFMDAVGIVGKDTTTASGVSTTA
ncbi:MAG: hypothetical protein U0905_10980 [Pirellulales bacterium]